MGKRYRIARKPTMTVRDVGDERQFVMTGPPAGAPPGATFATVRVELTRFADRLAALSDADIDARDGLARIVTDDDIAAVVATQELAAFFATLWGQGTNRQANREVQQYREIVSLLDWLRREMVGLRRASKDGLT